jgi:acetoin utilization deacetylase AcuC-like enzyme
MGFCLFNSVAVVARYLQKEHGLKRIFILDWDVHHGNGTQAMFWEDADVFYYSIHQFPYYPGTGAATEVGIGQGRGTTLNSPMAAGGTDDDYRRVFDETLVPALTAFRPEALIISAGFDAHKDDPLAGMKLTAEGYTHLTSIVLEAARPTCGGRILSLLEGGYDLAALSASVESHVGALAR